ncbi:MAG TPA: cupredoxin domain-containing protein [Chthoniobacteraceae bacterium]|nr:cupredoxin domain-containing protein [Chthoniobacteraceae bacterium]
MKTHIMLSFVAASALALAAQADDRTLGEKTSDALGKAKENAKEAGRAIADSSRKAAEKVTDAVTPDADARKIEVRLTEHQISMPKSLEAGKTAFVVTNSGTEKHNFGIEGQGLDKKFMLNLGPNDTKTLNVDLKPGTYKVFCPVGENAADGMSLNITVK